VLVVTALAAWAVTTRNRLQVLLATILASSLVPAVIALTELATGQAVPRVGSEFEAVRGPFSHPNYLAFYLVVVIAVGIIFILEARSRLARVLASVPLALAAVCLLLTYTRAAWIGFAFVLLLLAFLRERRILGVAAVVVLLAALAFPGTTSSVGERFGDLTLASEDSGDESWAWRTGQWERMVPHGLERPLTGEGFGSYSRVTVEEFGTRDPQYATVLDPTDPVGSPRGFTAHNDYVKMLVELGIPGLLLWSAVLIGIVSAMLAARRVPSVRGYADGGLAVAVALIVMSGSDHFQAYTAVLIYSLAFFGGIVGVARAARASDYRPSEKRGREAERANQELASALEPFRDELREAESRAEHAEARAGAAEAHEEADARVRDREQELQRAKEETERVAADERRAPEAEERARIAGEEALAEAQREVEAEVNALEEALKNERAERADAAADAERRVQETEEGARMEAEKRLGAELEKTRGEAERLASKGVAEARQETEREARELMETREVELRDEIRRLEDELRTAKRQLDEAQERVLAAEQRLGEVEAEAKEPPPEERPEEAAAPGAAGAVPPASAAPAAEPPPAGELVNLNSASFEQLRELGMSVTQAKRVTAYRDQRDGFDSVDDLDQVPGFPRAFLAELKEKLAP
jgi:O-antigen ligase/DNA uptake protein ComE-like DNA-binding protein